MMKHRRIAGRIRLDDDVTGTGHRLGAVRYSCAAALADTCGRGTNWSNWSNCTAERPVILFYLEARAKPSRDEAGGVDQILHPSTLKLWLRNVPGPTECAPQEHAGNRVELSRITANAVRGYGDANLIRNNQNRRRRGGNGPRPQQMTGGGNYGNSNSNGGGFGNSDRRGPAQPRQNAGFSHGGPAPRHQRSAPDIIDQHRRPR